MNVKELIQALKQFHPDMEVKVVSDDGNGICHDNPTIQGREQWTLSTSNMNQWSYQTVNQPIVEIS